MIRRPPRSTLFPSRRSSDLAGTRPTSREGDLGRRHGPALTSRPVCRLDERHRAQDRKSTRLNSSHGYISYAVFCLKKKKKKKKIEDQIHRDAKQAQENVNRH